MTQPQVLTREFALPQLMTPTGRQFGVRPYPANPSLYEIVYVDKKPGELPDKFKNHYFTKKPLALAALQKHLEEFWDTSDSKKK